MGYQRIEEIGRGSFGIVYEVTDQNGNRFALKEFLNPNLLGVTEEELKKRFEREVKYQSAIDNKNVVKIVDHDLNADPPYFVMELAERNTLKDEIDQDRSLGDNLKKVLFDILSGLEALQELGIVHRDLKPANILHFIEEDGTERYALSDFGLIAPGASSQTTTLTGPNRTGGTVNYAAPELATDFRRATLQSDIYSFGAILHDIFSGADRIPYSELNVPEPKTSRIVQKCTKILARRRYDSIEDLRDELFEALSDKVNFTSSEEEAVVNLLDSKIELSNDEWDRVFLCLESNENNDLSNGPIFHSISRDHIMHLNNSDFSLLKSLGVTFCEHVRVGTFKFEYCDVLAGKLKLFYEIGDIELQSQALLAILCLGVSHNRFYVERIFVRLVGSDAPENVIKRFIVDMEVNNIDFNDIITRLELSIGQYRAHLHLVLQDYLNESNGE